MYIITVYSLTWGTQFSELFRDLRVALGYFDRTKVDEIITGVILKNNTTGEIIKAKTR